MPTTLTQDQIEAVTKMNLADHAPLARLLERGLHTIGREAVAALLPKPFRLRIDSHDTGVHGTIYLAEQGLNPATVWYGSYWRSPVYESNDRGHMLGLSGDFPEAGTILRAFFAHVTAACVAWEVERALGRTMVAKAAEAAQRNAVDAYRAMLGFDRP